MSLSLHFIPNLRIPYLPIFPSSLFPSSLFPSSLFPFPPTPLHDLSKIHQDAFQNSIISCSRFDDISYRLSLTVGRRLLFLFLFSCIMYQLSVFLFSFFLFVFVFFLRVSPSFETFPSILACITFSSSSQLYRPSDHSLTTSN